MSGLPWDVPVAGTPSQRHGDGPAGLKTGQTQSVVVSSTEVQLVATVSRGPTRHPVPCSVFLNHLGNGAERVHG